MILITGGTGVIGMRLVQHWLKAGYSIRLLALPTDKTSLEQHPRIDVSHGDISNPSDIRNICKGVDTVYHLAAVILTHYERDFERVNVGGTRNILAEAERQGVRHFVYISSASVVYPKPTPYSISKKHRKNL